MISRMMSPRTLQRCAKDWAGMGLLWLMVQAPAMAQMAANVSPAVSGELPAEVIGPALTAPQQARQMLTTPELPPIQPLLPEAGAMVQVVIRLGDRRVYVYHDEVLQVSYPIGIGRQGWETPIGSFEVMGKLENPGWTHPFTGEIVPPGANNPLGERWISFWTDGTNYIGFHGTPNRDSVGQASSHGCIRMYNEHVRDLFDRVDVGTPVVVEP